MKHESFWITVLVLNPAVAIAAIVDLRSGFLLPMRSARKVLRGAENDTPLLVWRLLGILGLVQAAVMYVFMGIVVLAARDVYNQRDPSEWLYRAEISALLVVTVTYASRIVVEAWDALIELWSRNPAPRPARDNELLLRASRLRGQRSQHAGLSVPHADGYGRLLLAKGLMSAHMMLTPEADGEG